MRVQLMEQVRADLQRCLKVFETALGHDANAREMAVLCKTAHEVKGVAATIGASALADIAKQVERACTENDRATLNMLLPTLAHRSAATMQALADISRAA